MVMRPWVERFADDEEASACLDQCRQAALLLIQQHDSAPNKAAMGVARFVIRLSYVSMFERGLS